MSVRPTVCLTIAGSDSGGGAGIQADLKAFARCGVHGTSAITAITAQNTEAVQAVLPIPAAMILAQIRAVLADLPPAAVKIGMVGGVAAIEAVVAGLAELPAGIPVVLDPVMIAESGGRLLDQGAERALVEQLLPLATVVTPNVPEARVLARYAPGAGDPAELVDEALARAVLAAGAQAVILTGGHRDVAEDLVLTAELPAAVRLSGPRHPDGAAHGSGCTHASVLAANLALGRALPDAAAVARDLAGRAIAVGLRELGAGAGPVHVLGDVLPPV